MASIHTAATFTFRQDLRSISGSASLIPLSLSLEIGTYFAFTRFCKTVSYIWGHLTKTTAKSGRRPKCKKLKVSQLTELPRNSPPPSPADILHTHPLPLTSDTLQPHFQLYSPYSLFSHSQTSHPNVTLLLCSHNSLFLQIVQLGMCHPIVSSLPVPPRQERKFSHTLGVTALCLRRGTSAIGSQLIKHKCVNTSCILHLNDICWCW